MRQPTNAFGRISYPMCSRSSHLESGALFPLSLFLAVIVLGVWVLLRSLESWIFREMSLSVGAMLGSTVDFCSASVLWWLRTYFTHFLRCGGLESFSVLSPFGLNGEVCPVDASGCCLALRSSHLETSFSRGSLGCDVIRDRNFLGTCVSHKCRGVSPTRESDSNQFVASCGQNTLRSVNLCQKQQQ